MIQISGQFSTQEITDAQAFGAAVEVEKRSVNLKFSTKTAYNSWLREQRNKQPERWSTLIHINKKQ